MRTLVSIVSVLAITAAAVLASEGTAQATTYTWSSGTTPAGYLGTGPTTIYAPTLGLGTNVITIAPFYDNGYGFSVLSGTENGTSGNYKVWTVAFNGMISGLQWVDQDEYFAGLEVGETGSIEFGWSVLGKVSYQSGYATIPEGSWHINTWGNTTTQVYTSVGKRSDTDILLTNTGDTTCSAGSPNGPCIWYTDSISTTPASWGTGFGAEQVTIDKNTSDIYALDNDWRVWHLFKNTTWMSSEYTNVIANASTGSCTTGTGTLYADLIAAKGGGSVRDSGSW
jgi:hypothetical protein